MLDTIIPSMQDQGRQVLPTLLSLSQEEVSTIWANVSGFVERQLSLHKGVQIPGLGTFTFTRQKLERPDTVDSVLSSREILGKRPNSVLAFPRIDLKEVENKPHMETIVEEGRKNRQRKYKLKDQPDKEEGIREILSKRLQDKQAISPPKTTSVNLLNKLEQNRDGGKIMNPESLSSPGCLKNDSEMKSKLSPAPVCQDHNKAGQEMCYVCLQRAQRNSPLYYSEERKRREIEDERLIQQYQMLKDQEALLKHQMRSLASREQNKKNAAYNLGVAEAMRIYKNEKPAFYKSFLFDKRPLSPEINAFKQEEYSQSLLKQMDNRREKEIKQRQNRELMDRLEQVQLTEELAAQRAQYIKDKMEETQCYKRALDAQIKNKPLQLPMFEPDSCEPIFGKDEGELMVQKRKQEQSYMKHQLEAAARLKRKAILQQLVEQKQDLQMLRRTQKEHLADRNAELERVNRINQSLQEDWESSAAMKRQRDLEEKAFERASDKLFLLDQCEKYRRCKQCQRRTSNVGESNLWPLNKYLHGSRLLV
ncbi:coiled-coil domain-containing protein 81 isoform X3 [Canis lupus familiaris]|uniref:coiled-coil domain-containing protein 81 isoform X3 n=1 Tax=Canis lupus familiaris TaxID=9615 RepID=UPI0003AE715B|nr:coiled-coil domain-containing protein 81 isoform X3 [Canis lupus familiaris]XP_025275162.1 coiled-coil domain-containing protein 81 isoform X3 [Canis lupus dingo]XP_038285762.1 coiled-coil domain-containing protein 81 isoform X3 [Canis lupus familiaris]|eukprot:XP_005633447.1 coiled-coil domain-containing protein 81 isoform X3 [Canis lupus familiaris]